MIRRCAIYTRKSTDEGLDQAFNSLDAQREACEAYIASQRGEGWRAIKIRYDDGGLSGGNMERPALKALLQDIDDGKVDIIVVYKVDRLTRSLADFAKLVERFDKHEVSFVSVTQQFNTSNSMGRLMLNVLLSFAQFEREVGAERVRDKIAASRKKGIWTGGNPPLGYENVDKKLIVVEEEAAIVRQIYAQYADHGSVPEIIHLAKKKGWVTKQRANGRGGKSLSRGPVYHILKNPLYAGLMQTGGKLHDGEHCALIVRALWDAVQDKLKANSQWKGSPKNPTSPLSGVLYWNDQRMTPDHAYKAGRRYRYYVTGKNNINSLKPVRLKAEDVEDAVVHAIRNWLANTDDAVKEVLKEGASADVVVHARKALMLFKSPTPDSTKQERCVEMRHYFRTIVFNYKTLSICVDLKKLFNNAELDSSLKDEAIISEPVESKNRRQETRLLLGAREQVLNVDERLIALLARAACCKSAWFDNPETSLDELAKKHTLHKSDISKQIRLAFLAPDIVEGIISGAAPIELTSEQLRRLSSLPADWSKQRALLGYE